MAMYSESVTDDDSMAKCRSTRLTSRPVFSVCCLYLFWIVLGLDVNLKLPDHRKEGPYMLARTGARLSELLHASN